MMGSSSKARSSSYDYSFKILLIGDSGVGKSSILLSYISNFVQDLSPTIGLFYVFLIIYVHVLVDIMKLLQPRCSVLSFGLI